MTKYREVTKSTFVIFKDVVIVFLECTNCLDEAVNNTFFYTFYIVFNYLDVKVREWVIKNR